MPFSFADRDDRSLNDPISLIREFLDQLKSLLQDIIRDSVEGIDFKTDLGEELPLIEMVLTDCEERQVFERTSEAIYDSDIGEVGLAGPSLSGKLGVLEAFSGQFRQGVKKVIKYILDLVNSIVGSIKTALGPGGVVADAIAELKDLIKAKIDMANDW
ncbi:hypothetical protein [Roseibium sp. RKSG952]|uniref:hypothetical protein n=1 Tax=Roseibium sp. RKSG952 TaxID=2529384 RepID=UPI0012BD6FE8|nr:hypothetical protein [Roseibium sp. RKSG952]MTI02185.1 hypothetical protein [Roseibium sp. RKSG952]